MPSFARLPYNEEPLASRPYALRQPASPVMPQKDTLVAAKDFLQERGLVYGYPATEKDRSIEGPPPFPLYDHIGGLYAFTIKDPPKQMLDWLSQTVAKFTAFFRTCPQKWVETEEPVLLKRLEEYRVTISEKLPDGDR
jgi:hypothetical protein